jgi:uncharacterized membrane protein
MSVFLDWAAPIATLVLLLAYELVLALAQRRRPDRLARSAHATLREEWFAAVSQEKGTEILAVQALRNSLMSATMTASTAMLGLIGTVTLAAPSLQASIASSGGGTAGLTPRLLLELLLITLLFASLVSSAMAVRYFNHATFIGAIPVGSPAREHWAPVGMAYVRKGGLLYSWGLRHLLLVAPILASIVHPLAGPPAALLVVAALAGFDRVAESQVASSRE